MLETMLADPNAAFLLLTFGTYGIMLEVTSPGGIVPGIFGAVCFILGIMSLNMLPVDYTGLGIMGLGLALMAAEAFIPAFGALGILGALTFAGGGSILVDKEVYGSGVSWWVIGTTTLLTLVTILYILRLYLEARDRPVSTGAESLIGSKGKIMNWDGTRGEVLAAGVRWQAKSDDALKLKKEEKVKIIDIDGVSLIIKKEK